MNSTAQPPPISPPALPAPGPRLGFAIAGLVFGGLSVVLSLVVVGALFGLVGLVLCLAHLARRTGRNGLAWTGVGLSVLGIIASIGLAALYYPFVKQAIATVGQMQGGPKGSGFEKWEGALAPDFSVTTLDGQTIKLSELKGKRVVLDFWATWCPPCVKEIPHFIRLREQVPASEVVILGISSEDVDTLKAFVKAKRVNYAIASADNLPSPYKDVAAIPTTFFIDRQGVIQKVFVGYHEFDELKTQALAADAGGDPKRAPGATGQPASDASQTGKEP